METLVPTNKTLSMYNLTTTKNVKLKELTAFCNFLEDIGYSLVKGSVKIDSKFIEHMEKRKDIRDFLLHHEFLSVIDGITLTVDGSQIRINNIPVLELARYQGWIYMKYAPISNKDRNILKGKLVNLHHGNIRFI